MEFKLSKEQELIQKAAREYAEKRIEPIAFQIDRDNEIPREIYLELGELELMGIPFAEEYGGAGAGYMSYALVAEQLARCSSGVSLAFSVNMLGLGAINIFGTPEQKKQWLPPCCAGKKVASFAFTEPATGSDPKMITTTAKRDGDEYVINGTKRFISAADMEGPMVVFATDDESGAPTGFVVDKFCPGYSLSEPWEKSGMRGGHTYDVYFKDVRVPAANLIGEKGKGYPILQAGISYGKIGVSSTSLGGIQRALEESIKYAKEKIHRDKPIAKFPTIQRMVADIAIKVEAARWMTYRLAYLADNMKNSVLFAKESALTKTFVTETAVDVARLAVQLHGSYGVMKDYVVERIYRDVVIGEIVEGVNDMQRMIVAAILLR
ncbi:MAG: acyl-CoA dehydrogenase [Firmicutes bacterium]|nr:acyl-CoA dehydrogenase [Bacillota bacterium]